MLRAWMFEQTSGELQISSPRRGAYFLLVVPVKSKNLISSMVSLAWSLTYQLIVEFVYVDNKSTHRVLITLSLILGIVALGNRDGI